MTAPPTLILQYSRLDRGVYQCTSRHPEVGQRVGTIPLHQQIGTPTPEYGGHVYGLDWNMNRLLKDGREVGAFIWNHIVWNVGRYHGFCIDDQGTGWVMTWAEPDVPIAFLIKVNLDTAAVTFINEVWPGNYPDPVNGLIIAAVLDKPSGEVKPYEGLHGTEI